MIKITYVTITFNAAAVLRRTLDSVLSQDYPEITHLIIDGASTDDTMKIVDDYIERSNAADNGHRIHVTSEPDKGIYDAMNKGLRSVDGDYVCFLNAGDFLPSPNTVSHLIAAVARSSSAGLLPEGRKNSKLYTLNSQLIVRQLNTHQAHVMLGTRAYDIHHPLRIPLYLLTNILGGPGMNARLNISLRERNGLVYTVESTMVSYSDTGIWCIYFGCDSHDIKRCLKLVRRELDKMMQKPLSASQLRNAKRQLKGQIAIACDNREQFALDFGKSFLHYGWEKDITHLYESIDKVTAEDIQKVANELFATNMLTTLIYK